MPPLTLITGPSRSGKSEWAEHLAERSPRDVLYIATAQMDPTDAEWQARILKHQQRRPAHWRSRHVPHELAIALQTAAAKDCLLIDSLGTWLANAIDQTDDAWQIQATALLDSLQQTAAEVILVTEEVGWGVVPAYPLGRAFRDRLGRLTRQVGAIADAAYLVTAGYVLDLQHLGQHIDRLED
ncbi:MAG: bifunctional adenosylcobinamide kinase/adenosylcobinamide-phosphate guanylyltransferase [Elainellaceae cyanobacterium]|jgi:adenosylcobinamide kinase/adenosylcobinamide-phosphate guanylyltransferase